MTRRREGDVCEAWKDREWDRGVLYSQISVSGRTSEIRERGGPPRGASRLAGEDGLRLGVEELALLGEAAPEYPALEIGRGACRCQGRRLGRLAEMAEEPGDALGVLDERDDLGASAAPWADVPLDGEGTAQELRPGAIAGPMGRGGRRGVLVVAWGLGGVGGFGRGHDERPPVGGGAEHAGDTIDTFALARADLARRAGPARRDDAAPRWIVNSTAVFLTPRSLVDLFAMHAACAASPRGVRGNAMLGGAARARVRAGRADGAPSVRPRWRVADADTG